LAIRPVRQDTGSTVYQVTENSLPKSNIYCEIPYCSADSRYFVFSQDRPGHVTDGHPDRRDASPPIFDSDYIVCEIGTWERRLGGRGCGGIAMTHRGIFYFLRRTKGESMELTRLDLETGESEVACELEGPLKVRGLATVSPSGRYYAYGVVTDDRYREYGIEMVDLEEGRFQIIDRDPYILNPHPQFEPSEGRWIMVQQNRGGKIDERGNRIRLVGEEGATLYLLDIADQGRTTLRVGKPYTTPCTGHQAWIGGTKEILLTVSGYGPRSGVRGNLLGVRPDGRARVVSSGHRFAHVGTSVCGRFFCCDEHGTGDIIIGSIKTGKNAVVCHSESSFSPGIQDTHPHPYLTPDLKWVIFNSDRSGEPQIHAATVPDDMIGELDDY